MILSRLTKSKGIYLIKHWHWDTKVWEAKRIRDPCSPYPKLRVEKIGFIISFNVKILPLYLGSTGATQKPKNIDGTENQQWSMLFNSMVHAKPYHFLQYFIKVKDFLGVIS